MIFIKFLGMDLFFPWQILNFFAFLVLWFPASLLFCRSTFLFLCFSAFPYFTFVASLLLCFFALPACCFSCFSAVHAFLLYLLLFFLLCFSIFCAFLLLLLLFYFVFSSIMCFCRSTSCSSSSLLPNFTTHLFSFPLFFPIYILHKTLKILKKP